jgi:hypothetical protein
MPDSLETCTCGTVLAENARFCHRCGRPVYEVTAPETKDPTETVVPATPEPQVITPQPPPVGFGNPIALRVAFLMSLGIMMTEMLPVVNLLFFAWWLLAGWGGVRLYRRLTGLRLTVAAGARLGVLTGIFAFVSMAVVLSFTMASSVGREMLDQMVKQDPRMSEVVNSPVMLGAVLVMVLVMVFAMVVGICAAGGALGAKLAPPERKS